MSFFRPILSVLGTIAFLTASFVSHATTDTVYVKCEAFFGKFGHGTPQYKIILSKKEFYAWQNSAWVNMCIPTDLGELMNCQIDENEFKAVIKYPYGINGVIINRKTGDYNNDWVGGVDGDKFNRGTCMADDNPPDKAVNKF